MALIVVLWGVALLSLISLSLLSTSTASYRVARNSIEAAQVEATAEAALARAVLALLDARPANRWRIDGIAQRVDIGGTAVRIAIQDELGRIDLNHADAALLVRLFQAAGLDGQAAGRLVERILAWRASNAVGRSSASDQGDRTTGQVYRPRHGAFQSVDEVKLVVGMTPDLFSRVEPALTVYSGQQFFDPRTAPREALLALPSMDAEQVASVLAVRAQAAPQSVAPAPIVLIGRAVTVRAEIERPTRLQTYDVVIRLTASARTPYWVLAWKSR